MGDTGGRRITRPGQQGCQDNACVVARPGTANHHSVGCNLDNLEDLAAGYGTTFSIIVELLHRQIDPGGLDSPVA